MFLVNQVPLMQWIQGLFEWGQPFFKVLFAIITFLGEELALYIIIPAIYWCYNKDLGELVAMVGFFSMTINGAIKDSVKIDRPFVEHGDKIKHVIFDNMLVDTSVETLHESFSFPSGHSQGVAGLVFSIAAYFKKKSFWIIATIVTLLVMLSRVFLGVHWPLDVLVGGILGAVIAVLCYIIFMKFKDKRILLYFVMSGISVLTLLIAAKPDTFKAIGAMLGFAVGALVEHKYINFEIQGVSKGKRAIRLIIGIIILFALKVGLKELFALISEHVILDFIRYFILVFIAIGIYPMLFKKLKI